MKQYFDNFDNFDSDEVIYYEKVKQLADNSSTELISNGDIKHAIILIHQLLIRAQQKVRILTTCLDEKIYNNIRLVEAVKQIVNKNVEIEILIQKPNLISQSNEFLNICKSYTNCKLRIANNPNDPDLISHYITMDEKAYRFCSDSNKQHDPADGSVSAIASFGRPELVKRINSWFDKKFHESNKFAL